ncbi:hypothetical protein EYV94_26760 [Puteibacter caeruleilacunae]|nr:hypothetical protein EYV94_26760 [Puteibacter caeruleilacunae]
MKRSIQFSTLFTVLLIASIILTSGKPKKKSPIFGTWKLVSCKINNKDIKGGLANRTMAFKEDYTLAAITNSRNIEESRTMGQFFLANDTTFISLHVSRTGKPAKHSYTYNFYVENDSLHLIGNYYRGIPGHPDLLSVMHNEEWWVRVK